MSNSYYNHTTYPTPNAPGSSAQLRAELAAISDGFDKLPTLSANANQVVVVNGTANALITTSALSGLAITSSTINSTPIGGTTPSTGAFTTVSASSGFSGNLTGNVTGNLTGNVTGNLTGNVTGDVSGNAGTVTDGVYLNATQTLTNKTFNLANNTLVATSAQLAAAISDETGTGSLMFANSPALTGVPTAPTATTGTNTTQIATTAFVTQTAFAATLPDQTGNSGRFLTTNGSVASWATLPGGDVTGPASSTNDNIVLFNGATGKLIKDSGVSLSSKQDALVSGTNIRTVNGTTLLGSGNVSVGTVTSVGMTVPAFLSVGGTPVTGSGTLAVTLSGTALPEANGGTGQTSYTIGDILYASGATALTKLAGVATGNALISGGVGAAPSWGKISLSGTQHVSGTLPVGNGGTGAITLTGVLKGNGTSAFTAATAGTDFVAPGTATNFTAPQRPSLASETAPSANALTWDLTTNSVMRVNLNANITTLTLSGTLSTYAGYQYQLIVRINGGTSITWPSSVKWPGGTAPTLTSTSGKVDIFNFVVASSDGGTTFFLLNTGSTQNL